MHMYPYVIEVLIRKILASRLVGEWHFRWADEVLLIRVWRGEARP